MGWLDLVGGGDHWRALVNTIKNFHKIMRSPRVAQQLADCQGLSSMELVS
jgi:hypothetical protein